MHDLVAVGQVRDRQPDVMLSRVRDARDRLTMQTDRNARRLGNRSGFFEGEQGG